MAVDTARQLLNGEAAAQLVRFVVAGVGVTLFSTLVYLGLAVPLHVSALAANAIGHGCGIVAGYQVHSRWSFRAGPGEAGRLVRFTMGSGFAFLLNSFWVWLAVAVLHLPAWTPVPAMMLATPLASFALNRCWVFGRA